jgi:predicted SAM-dependent methyltransferase
MKEILIAQYKKLPFDLRSRLHHVYDATNGNKALIALVSPIRQKRTIRKISRLKSPRRLVVGESYPMDGWIISNYQVLAKNFLDITKKFAGSGSISNIYADNVIEHLELDSARLFMKNAFDSLLPGGSIRLVTPDCLAMAHAYIQKDLQKVKQVATDLKQHGLKIDEPIDLLHETFAAFGHHIGRIYDEDTLTSLLLSAGFSSVERFPTSKSNNPVFQNLEKRVGDSLDWSQLCLEARK